MNERRRRRGWLATAVMVVTSAVGFLVAAAALLIRKGPPEPAVSWSNVVSAVLAYVVAVVGLVAWLVRRARRGDGVDDEASDLGALRRAVEATWGREQMARQLYLPRPLRLRWRPTRQAGVVITGSSCGDVPEVGGSLLAEADDRPAAVELVEAFRDPALRQLVVLGEAGAGKSTLAVLYVVAAVAVAEDEDPVPVPLSLATWNPGSSDTDPAGGTQRQYNLEEWIISRICVDYPQLTAAHVSQLLARRRIIPVLDGLDEIPLAQRGPGLRQLEHAAAAGLRMLVTCRSQEYAAITADVGVLPQATVVDIEPVPVSDAISYLTQREARGSLRWEPVTEEMASHPTGPLAAALSTPLMISLARQVYQSPTTRPGELAELATCDDVQQQLLTRFLPSVYGPVRAAKAARWLGYLVSSLPDHPRDPDLHWWRLARTVPRPVITMLIATIVVVLGALSGVPLMIIATGDEADLTGGLFVGVAVGLVVGLASGLQSARAAHAAGGPGGRRPWLRAGAAALHDMWITAGILAVSGALILALARLVAPDGAETMSMDIVDVVSRHSQGTRVAVFITLVLGFFAFALFAVTNGLGARGSIPHRSTPRLRALPVHLLSGIGAGLLIAMPLAATVALAPRGAIGGLTLTQCH